MSKLVLLVVGAAWAAVLLPPLLRSRLDARPGTSISSFRRQLTSLQRSVPGSAAPMRSMARPLSGPTRHGYAAGYHAPQQYNQRGATVVSMDRRYRLDQSHPMQRRHVQVRSHLHAGQARSVAKQRRQNVLVALAIATVSFGFLSVATTAQFARYGLVLSVCLLVGYVYLLVQIRRNEILRSGYDAWQRAA